MQSWFAFLRRFVPHLAPVSNTERLRAALGALVGILLTGFATSLAGIGGRDLPMLIAPMGASAVLLFAVPASPLAQPWSIIGGNVISALIGVACAMLVPDQVLAASLAIGLAIAVMMLCRCLHPPGGAVALTALLGGPAIHAAGFGFALAPVAVNSLLMLAVALIFNNVTGKSYPHVPHHAAPVPADPKEFTAEDLRAVLAEYDEVIPVDTDDLEDILRQAEARAAARAASAPTTGRRFTRG